MGTSHAPTLLQRIAGRCLAGLAWAVTGVRPIWDGCGPGQRQRIYYANHTSHGDFILIFACLRAKEWERTAAVAGADYWHAGPIRRFVADHLLRTVLVERNWVERSQDPISTMLAALDQGQSLILFPEGTRNMTDERLLRFKSGLFNLVAARPDIELIPCWIENMARVMPKGAVLPVPFLCRVVFGPPLVYTPGEDRKVFLQKARDALLRLAPFETDLQDE